MTYFGVFESLNSDKSTSVPQTPKLQLQQWDNYGIYTLACVDAIFTLESSKKVFKTIPDNLNSEFEPGRYYTRRDKRNIKYEINADTDSYVIASSSNTVETKEDYFHNWLAYQSFSVLPIPVNFRDYVVNYPGNFPEEIRKKEYKLHKIDVVSKQSHIGYYDALPLPTENAYDCITFYNQWVTIREQPGSTGGTVPISKPGFTPYNHGNNFVFTEGVISYAGLDWFAARATYFQDVAGDDWSSKPFAGYSTNTNYDRYHPSPASSNYSEVYLNALNDDSIAKFYNFDIRRHYSYPVTYSAFYKVRSQNLVINYPTKPSFINLLFGYEDNLLIPQTITYLPSLTKTISVGYYRVNPFEEVNCDTPTGNKKLKSINWVRCEIKLIKGKEIKINIAGIVLGTFWSEDSDLIANLQSQADAGFYAYKYLLANAANISELFNSWEAVYNTKKAAVNENIPAGWFVQDLIIWKYAAGTPVKIIAAHNNYWQNGTVQGDLNVPTASHPMYELDADRIYNQHFVPLGSNLGLGILNMNSPEIIEIHAALSANKYAVNDLDNELPRITTLGYLIENVARILGLRLDANGSINNAEEKTKYLPATLNSPTLGQQDDFGKYSDYGINCFGRKGMIVPHLPTSYNQQGREQKLYDVIHDIPQLQQAILRQLDIALGIQHGSEIRVRGLDGKVQSYPNQLALNLHFANQLEKIQYNTDKIFNLTTVTGNEVRELFSGIGIPVTQKFINMMDIQNKNTVQLPYFGHQKNKPSVIGELATVKINLAVINGVLMPKKNNGLLNPFKVLAKK